MGAGGGGPEAPCGRNPRRPPRPGGGLRLGRHLPQPAEPPPPGELPGHPSTPPSLSLPYPSLLDALWSRPLTLISCLARGRGKLRVFPSSSGRGLEDSSVPQAWLLSAPRFPCTHHLFLGQSQVIAVDKGEAAICLTHENAQR